MKIVCIVDDPAIVAAAPGLREHHAQRELGGTQWIVVAMADGATLGFLESAGVAILDERDPAGRLPAAVAAKFKTPRLPGETMWDYFKRATGGFDVRKFG